jgi:hypothetical protein
MKSKEELISFLEKNVLIPVENNTKATTTIKRKVKTTRMRLNNLRDCLNFIAGSDQNQFQLVEWG